MEGSNVTQLPEMNITADQQQAAPVPAWIHLLTSVQLTGAIVGVIANLATLITLTVNGEGFSDTIKMLFKYQSVMDCLCCLEAAVLFTLPPMGQTGNQQFDWFICQVWHSQYIYWTTVTISIFNLVTLALERYLCICHPLKYQAMTRHQFKMIVLGLLIFAVTYISPSMVQVRYSNGTCHSEFYWNGKIAKQFFYVYGISAFFIEYANPCAAFFIFYGLIIISFRQRATSNLGASTSSNVIDKATNQITKTAIVVTVIFIITLGVDLWYYLLAYVGLVKYVFNSPLQKVSVFFAVVNSVVNPFIYAAFMPLYRKSVKDTFFKKCQKA